MIKSAIAALWAMNLGWQFQKDFEISITEIPKYYIKCCRLALCYGGFPKSNQPIKTAIRAGAVGFLCCVYDVATDWHGYSTEGAIALDKVLRELIHPDCHQLAIELYWRDFNNELGDDGLERGSMALRFAVDVMNIESQFDGTSIAEAGALLQIVDDILDFDADRRRGEQNCLLTPRRLVHLKRFSDNLPQLRRLFSHSPIMRFVLGKAERNAKRLES